MKCSAMCRCVGCKNKDPAEERQQQPTLYNLSMNIESVNPYNIQESLPFNMDNESQGRSIMFGMRDESQGKAIGFSGCLQGNSGSISNQGNSKEK